MNALKRRPKLTKSDWQSVLNSSAELSKEDRAIIELLAQGTTQVRVGEQLGLHRSVVWRKARDIAERHRRVPG